MKKQWFLVSKKSTLKGLTFKNAANGAPVDELEIVVYGGSIRGYKDTVVINCTFISSSAFSDERFLGRGGVF